MINKRIKRFSLVLFLTYLIIGRCFVLAGADIKPNSPTAEQFLRYDKMPINQYTGILSISIPLYSIVENELRMDLNLMYHAGGIKANQESTWVGLGWDLQLGGIIQIINDEDDTNDKISVFYKIVRHSETLCRVGSRLLACKTGVIKK